MHFPRMFSESGYPSDLIQMEFIVSDAQIKKADFFKNILPRSALSDIWVAIKA